MESQKNRLLVRLLFVVALTVQSSCSESVEDVDVCANRTASLVGDTMCSLNNVPFVWAPEYEVAIVYITSTWSEIATFNSSAEDTIAKEAFLSYCVRFKNNMFNFMKKLHDDPSLVDKVKKAVIRWYEDLDQLSRNNWYIPSTSKLQDYPGITRTAFKHLIINAVNVFEKANTKKTQLEVGVFTKKNANIMVEVLKTISKQIRQLPKTTSE
ncbi:uncharacterized protein LOC126846145 isoform X1 [Adelges cooleyi]|uniref:uncharacterized protein LOC126846145 isoform X1 n=1 Tax=Adelges cooleyi TaxID=133065 RepID=UPI00218058B6|nr:uncharacterized protein LOC126846145 isoform X1 [Adelges cooleyi]